MNLIEIARKDNISLAEREFLENCCREVVFCRDCCFGEKIKDTTGVYCCSKLGRAVLVNDFCSRAERKGKQNER